MASSDCGKLPTVEARRRCNQRHERVMFGIAFPLCLFVAAVARLPPRSRRAAATGFGGGQSLLTEARIAASMCIPFALR